MVAGQYRPHRHLIGPTFFPVYLFALKAGLGVTALITVVVAMLSVGVNSALRPGLVEILAFPARGLMVFAWITIAFVVLDLSHVRLPMFVNWDPRHLPPVATLEHRISRFESLCMLLLSSAALVWLLWFVRSSSSLLLGGAGQILEFRPVFDSLYLPIVLLTAANVLLSAINFARPFWTPARSLAGIALHLGSALLLITLLSSGALVAAKAGATLPSGQSLERLVEIINVGCRIGLIAASLAKIGQIVVEILRIRSGRRAASPPTPAAARAR